MIPVLTGKTQEPRPATPRVHLDILPLPPLDQDKILAYGIRSLSGRHVTLFTDIRDRSDIDELPEVFDQAVPQWCRYFGVDESEVLEWRMRGSITADRDRFVRAGLWPTDLPDFPAGFQRGHEMWVYLQPGNYYTRHLLLHEGTHAFMQIFLDGTGAPWYTEGMAELLGVHQWNEKRLQLNYELRDRSEAEYWGRIKIVQDDCEAGKAMTIEEVLNIPSLAFREVRYYAWSWAACEFFSRHPLSREEFKGLQQKVSLPPENFNAEFAASIAAHREALDRDWLLFIHEIDYAYDIARGTLHQAQKNGTSDRSWTVRSENSWQETGVTVRPGDCIRIVPRGRFKVGEENGKEWPCEAGGITIRYYRGRPLGELVAGVLGPGNEVAGLLQPKAIGTGKRIEFNRSGQLCLRINESPNSLADNEGSLEVEIIRSEDEKRR